MQTSDKYKANTVTRFGRIWQAWRTKGWLKPFRSAVPLLIGRGAQGVLSLAAVALATRTLGADVFGILVLITSFRQIATGLMKLRARETIMRFGAQAIYANDMHRFRRLLRFGFAVDILSATVAIMSILLFADIFTRTLDLPTAYRDMARLFGLSAGIALVSTTCDGILRLFDRFDLVAVQTVLSPAVQASGAFVLFLTGGGLSAFLVAWFTAIAVSRLWLIIMAFRELRMRGVGRIGMPCWCDFRWPEVGVWHLTFGGYLNHAAGEAKRHGAVLVIGAMLNPAAAGLLRIAQQIGTIPGKPVNKVLAPAIYPEMARLTAAKAYKKRGKMTAGSGLIAAGFALVLALTMVVFGKTLINNIFGQDFIGAYIPMLIIAINQIITNLIFPIRPFLESIGRIYFLVIAKFANIGVWIAFIWILVPGYAVEGAALAELISTLIISIVVFIYAYHHGFSFRPSSHKEASKPI